MVNRYGAVPGAVMAIQTILTVVDKRREGEKKRAAVFVAKELGGIGQENKFDLFLFCMVEFFFPGRGWGRYNSDCSGGY